MKKNLLAAGFCLLSFSVIAQKQRVWGIEAGTGISRLVPAVPYVAAGVGYSFGVFHQWQTSKAIFLRAGAGVTSIREKQDVPGTSEYDALYISNRARRLTYLRLPIMAGISSNGRSGFFVQAGPYAGVLLSATERFKSGARLDVSAEYRSFDFGLCAAAGARFAFGTRHSLSFEVRENLGLAPIRRWPLDYESGSMGAQRTQMLELVAGLRFHR